MGLPIPVPDKDREKKSGSLPVPPPSAAGDKKEKKGLPVPPEPSDTPVQKPSGGLGAALPKPAPGLPKEPPAPRTEAPEDTPAAPPEPQKRKRGTGLPKPPMSTSETISGLPSVPRDKRRRGNALPTRNGRAIIPQRGSLASADGVGGSADSSSDERQSPLSRAVRASGRGGAADGLGAAAPAVDEDFEYTDPAENADDYADSETASTEYTDTDVDAPAETEDADVELSSIDDLMEEFDFGDDDDAPDENFAQQDTDQGSDGDYDETDSPLVRVDDDEEPFETDSSEEDEVEEDEVDRDAEAGTEGTASDDDDDSYLREMFFSDSDIDIDELFDDSPSAEDLYGDSSAGRTETDDSEYDDSSAEGEYEEDAPEAADDDYYWDEDPAEAPQLDEDYGTDFDIEDFDNVEDADDYGYDDTGTPEDDESDGSDEGTSKKSPKKKKKPKKSSASGAAGSVKKAFEGYYKWLMSLIRALGRLPVVGKPFRLLANAERVLRLLAPLFPILIPLLIWVLVNMFYPSNEHTVDDLPDEGAATAAVESYDPDSNTAVVSIENTGEIMLNVSAHAEIYSTQFGLNPVSWILPQPATTCRTDWILVEQADIETVEAQCEATEAGGFWFRGSVEEILE